jgi:proline racemase
MFRTVETHTLGQPTRNVISGFPKIPGKTIAEKYTHMKKHEDWFRKILTYEPRGSEIMSGTLFTEPCTSGTDIGILYFEASGWMPMCGHDTIGATVALIESGLVEVQEPYTRIKIDTAAGVVDVEAKVEDGVVLEVSFLNAPSMVLKHNAKIITKEFGNLTIDIVWGGNVFAIVPAQRFGLSIEPNNCGKMIEIAQSIAKDINEQIEISHPEFSFVNSVTHVEFSGHAKSEGADIINCVVALPKVIDRSPCGTGTSAKAAQLFYEGQLKVGDSFIHESVIGSLFKCEIVEETTVEKLTAIRTRITGNACVIGFATWILDPKDPFQEGFILN